MSKGPTPLDYALAYARLGWNVLPVWSVDDHGQCRCGRPNHEKGHKAGKHPQSDLVPHGHHDATTDEATIRDWWATDPDAGIGIELSTSGLLALDIDPQNGGDESLRALEAEHGVLHSDCTAVTQGGGEHRLFSADSTLSYPGTLDAGLDLKHHGYICVAPTSGPSGIYQWEAGRSPLSKSNPAQPSPLPALIASKARAPVDYSLTERGGVPVATAQTFDDLRSALEHVDFDDYTTWVNVGMVLKPYGENGYKVWTEWASRSDKFDAAAQRRKWERDISAPHSITYRSIFRMAIDNGWKGNNKPATANPDAPFEGENPDPENLFESNAPSPFNPALCLPAVLANWVKLHAAASGVDAIGYAFACLPVLAAATDRNIRINLGLGHNVPVILWAAIVGETGTGKSPVMNAAHKPLSFMNALEVQRTQAEKRIWDEAPKGSRAPNPPSMKRTRYTADTTTEAMTANLAKSDGPRLLVHYDEGSGWLNNMGRYSSGGDGDRATYLSSWLGLQNHVVSRVGRGEIFVPELGVNILFGITPNKIKEGLKEASAEGLLARPLLCVISRHSQPQEQKPNEADLTIADKKYAELVQALTEVKECEIVFSSPAQDLFVLLRKKYGEQSLALELAHPALAAVLAKAAENVGRLAGLFRLCRKIESSKTGFAIHTPLSIEIEDLKLAEELMKTGLDHAQSAYTGVLMTDESTTAARECALKVLRLHHDTPAMSEIRRDQLMKITSFRTADKVTQAAALDLLRTYHWIIKDTTQRNRNSGGRFSDGTRWLVNPKALDGRFKTYAFESVLSAQAALTALQSLRRKSG